ncbi:XdhC family protein [Brevibacterium sp.]|uniref:XdhC family protein n=1 Tax=Brevibacterium sp. TaxID=1701 RepID=UPI00281242D8|nr:XdhC family protein [Brevibacterium sp.]
MLDILTVARELLFDPQAPQDVAIATIIAAEGSVPRPVGTSMMVDSTGAIHGSLTGGCVEAAVVAACTQVLESSDARVERFGYSAEDAFAVGLMCGGSIDVLVLPIRAGDPALAPDSSDPSALVLRIPPAEVADRAEAADRAELTDARGADGAGGPPSRWATAVPDSPSVDALECVVPAAVAPAAAESVAAMIGEGRTGRVRIAACDGDREPIELFVETRTSPAHLVILGANVFSQALVHVARPLGRRITVCDPRPAFTDPGAFPGAEVVRAWPHRFLADLAASGDLDSRSAVCVLTHDPKVDTPALIEALDLDVAYVGAMGSRRSDRQRRDALRNAGMSAEALNRLHSPIGLDIGALTPAEVAISILAEILASRHGRAQVEPLSHGSGPLHPPAADDSR